jgi:hypothetical protein
VCSRHGRRRFRRACVHTPFLPSTSPHALLCCARPVSLWGSVSSPRGSALGSRLSFAGVGPDTGAPSDSAGGFGARGGPAVPTASGATLASDPAGGRGGRVRSRSLHKEPAGATATAGTSEGTGTGVEASPQTRKRQRVGGASGAGEADAVAFPAAASAGAGASVGATSAYGEDGEGGDAAEAALHEDVHLAELLYCRLHPSRVRPALAVHCAWRKQPPQRIMPHVVTLPCAHTQARTLSYTL